MVNKQENVPIWISGLLPEVQSRVKIKSSVCDLELLCDSDGRLTPHISYRTVPGSTPLCFPSQPSLWWIPSPLPIDIFISPFSLPATCISVTIAYEGQKTLKLTYWGGDTFAHVNGKSGVRAAAQTILSNCFLFSISRSTSVVLTPFSDIPPPAPWCQDIPPPAPWLPPTLALPYMLLGSSPRERPRLPQQSNQNCGSDSLVSQSETGCPLHIDDWWQGSA